MYVDDVVHAIELILCKGKTKMIYTIGTLTELTVLDIATRILAKMQPDRQLNDAILYVKPRSFTEQRYYSKMSEILKALGWTEQVTFDEGLEKTIQWYTQNQNYWVNQ